MKRTLLFWWIVATGGVFAQPADTLIYATGKITSAATKEAVVANISYQSLPYGSKVGLLTGSDYRFPLFDGEKYSITVEAAGYSPAKYLLDPAEANAERLVIKDIELGLPHGAAEVAKDVHTVGRVLVLKSLIFEQGKAKINQASFAELDSVVMMMNPPRST